jgi:UDP-glucuronate decarboxylase
MMDYHRQNQVDVKIARIFNTYGPRMAISDGRVVSNFIVQALENKPLTIYGDGSQTRSFCYVSDMVEGMIRMMNSDDFIGPVNLGNPTEFSIENLANLVLEITRSKAEIVYKPLPEDDPIRRCPDVTLAKEKLKWEPVVPLRKGLEHTIEYFRQVLS